MRHKRLIIPRRHLLLHKQSPLQLRVVEARQNRRKRELPAPHSSVGPVWVHRTPIPVIILHALTSRLLDDQGRAQVRRLLLQGLRTLEHERGFLSVDFVACRDGGHVLDEAFDVLRVGCMSLLRRFLFRRFVVVVVVLLVVVSLGVLLFLIVIGAHRQRMQRVIVLWRRRRSDKVRHRSIRVRVWRRRSRIHDLGRSK
ncbi:hypothetical protein C8R46DRAFT_1055431 [Mycena filopes]|nr:hypothetical protein C8R46DRAFT_1055431 [Mycena filopes]